MRPCSDRGQQPLRCRCTPHWRSTNPSARVTFAGSDHFWFHERGELRNRTDRAGHFCLCRFAAHTRSASARTETCIRVATRHQRGSPSDAVCAGTVALRIAACGVMSPGADVARHSRNWSRSSCRGEVDEFVFINPPANGGRWSGRVGMTSWELRPAMAPRFCGAHPEPARCQPGKARSRPVAGRDWLSQASSLARVLRRFPRRTCGARVHRRRSAETHSGLRSRFADLTRSTPELGGEIGRVLSLLETSGTLG